MEKEKSTPEKRRILETHSRYYSAHRDAVVSSGIPAKISLNYVTRIHYEGYLRTLRA